MVLDGRMLHLELVAGFMKVRLLLVWMILTVIPLKRHIATTVLMKKYNLFDWLVSPKTKSP